MIPGKQYTPEVILQIAWRRKWFIAIPAFVIALGASIYVYRLPDLFESVATIRVMPQRVPEQYVRSTVTTNLAERLESIATQILSRTQLERIILEFNLYQDERKTEIMEDVVSRMREKDVVLSISKGETFSVGFRNNSARMSKNVAERLASLFIDESSRDRSSQADNTNQFLEAQLEDARRRLSDQEKKREEYRRKFDGQLPEQLSSNLQGMHNTETELFQLNESLNRDREHLRDLDRRISEAAVEEVPALQAQRVGGAALQLMKERQDLAALSLRLQPDHPSIVAKKARIEALQKLADQEAEQQPVDAVLSPVEAARRARLESDRHDLENLKAQIADKTEREKQLRAAQGAYQARIAATPAREAELTDLSRDYPTVQSMFSSLAVKKEDAQLAANLEQRQIGEQFKIIDNARVPARPSSPDRPRLYLMSVVVGLAAGLALAGLLEYLNRTMRSEDDVRAALGLPVLAAIPLVSGPSAARQRTRRIAMSASAAAAMLATAAVVAWKLLR